MRLGRSAALAGAAGLILAGLSFLQPATAQSAYCDRLRADLAAVDRASANGRTQPYAEQIRRQRAELDRTVGYARSLGCGRQRFFIFGDASPQCAPLEAQINRLEAGLAQLDAQAYRSGGAGLDSQRNSILAALDSNCRGVPQGNAADRRQPGLYEQLFGGVPSGGEVPEMPEDEPSPVMPGDDPVGLAQQGKTLCVRKCDGFYFPISASAARNRYETDAGMCQASCPNTDVELFVQAPGQDVANAVSLRGDTYSALPNAFRYRKALDPACTCKKPGQNWADTLTDAERMLTDKRNTDVTVTEQQAQELSRAPAPLRPGVPASGAAPGTAPAAPRAARPPGTPQAQAPALKPALPSAEGAPPPQKPPARVEQGKRDVRVVAPTLAPETLVPR